MIYLLLIVCVIITIDRLFAVKEHRDLEDKVTSTNVRLTRCMNELDNTKKDIKELKKQVNEDRSAFKHEMGKYDGVLDRFVSIERQIDIGWKCNNHSIMNILNRLEVVEKCAIGNKSSVRGHKGNKKVRK